MRLAALYALLASPFVWGQLQLYAVADGREQPLGQIYDLGDAATGDIRSVALRVRNTGTAPAQITRLTVDGAGFRLERPALPVTVGAGASVDARLDFSADAPAAYSANLQMNGTSVLVLVTARIAPVLSVSATCAGLLPRTVDFGSVEAGTLRLCGLHLQNPSAEPMTIRTFAVSGEGFSGPVGRTPPFVLAAGQTTSFTVHFVAPRAGSFTGALAIETRAYILLAKGLNPPLPKPLLDLDSAPIGSAQQRRLTVRLPEPAPFDANGNIQLSFLPESSVGGDDPGVMFVEKGSRTLPFAVRRGSSEVAIDGQAFATVQTGTSAGRLRFTLSGVASGFASDPTALFVIPRQPIAVESAEAIRGLGRLSVSVTGYDNAYTAGPMTFTFHDPAGRVVGDGPVRADFSTEFRDFYTAAKAGSVFQLVVVFPVTGDASAIASVDVELVNSAGTVRAPRLMFR